MTERGSEQARRAVALACRGTTDPMALFERVGPQLRRAIPFDAACWETTDPATTLPTAGVAVDLPEDAAPAYFENEYCHPDVNKFHDLAQQDPPVARLSDATGGDLSRSRRYRELYRPRGFEHEMRAALTDGGSCWGALALIRSRREPDFSDSEVSLVASLAGHIGRALRVAYLVIASGVDDDPDAPGVIVLDDTDRVMSLTGAGERWLDQLRETAMTLGEGLPLPIQAIVAKFRGLAVGSSSPAPSLRLRTRSGRWVIIHAAAMSGADGGAVAVVIQHARPVEIVPLMLVSYGLTHREGEVAQLLLLGLPIKAIAGRLEISPYTVQDHLRAIYTKLEVPGRQEMAARVFYDRYWPRLMPTVPADRKRVDEKAAVRGRLTPEQRRHPYRANHHFRRRRRWILSAVCGVALAVAMAVGPFGAAAAAPYDYGWRPATYLDTGGSGVAVESALSPAAAS